MKHQLLSATYILISFLSIPSSNAAPLKATGDITNGPDAQTFYSEYKGKHPLKVGDKVQIREYNFSDLKHRQSKTMPFKTNSKVVGEATVSSIIKDNYYELKTDEPQHISGDAFIEKL